MRRKVRTPGARLPPRGRPARSRPHSCVDFADVFEELKRLDVFLAEQHE